MNANTLRSFGLSLLLLGLALGSLGRTLHVADSIKMAFTGLSLVCSLSAIGLYLKAAPPNRRPMILGVVVAGIVAAAAFAYLFLRRAGL